MSDDFRSTPEILVVDDDEGLLVLMGETLRSEGYRIVTARSGAEVIALLERRRPALMVLDLKLKDTDGLALLERIEQLALMVPFIVVTGQGDEKVAVKIMRRGALDYVSKDTAMLDLLPGVVSRALAALARERALAESAAERTRLERQILEISESEQRRIGADLHDGLGQLLTAAEILCAALKEDLQALPAYEVQVARVGGMLREAIAQVRSLSRGLVPVKDEPDALWVSLIELAERTSALGRVECVFNCQAPVVVNQNAVAVHLYRIAQEAVNNALKHAQARRIAIELRDSPAALELEIADDGEGLKYGARGNGLGLQIMRHRANVIGAQLTLGSRPSGGLRVLCHLPKKERHG